MGGLLPKQEKVARELERREQFETYTRYGQSEDSEWEETPEEVIDEMLETYDVIVCSNCKTEYSFLTAEWADGDSVASHIAVNGDYFCTNDSAKKAGSNSVLSIIYQP